MISDLVISGSSASAAAESTRPLPSRFRYQGERERTCSTWPASRARLWARRRSGSQASISPFQSSANRRLFEPALQLLAVLIVVPGDHLCDSSGTGIGGGGGG